MSVSNVRIHILEAIDSVVVEEVKPNKIRKIIRIMRNKNKKTYAQRKKK